MKKINEHGQHKVVNMLLVTAMASSQLSPALYASANGFQIVANDYYQGYENVVPSISDLIDFYGVGSKGGHEVTVDVNQSEVLYDVPGVYNITFTITDEDTGATDTKTVEYEVIDVPGTIDASNQVNVFTGDSVIDYISEFNVTATEFHTNDILSSVTVSGTENIPVTNGVYTQKGHYTLTFTATDSDGMQVSISRELHVITPSKPEVPVIELELSANEYYSDYEGVEYTDSDLYTLFSVDANNDNHGVRTLSVDHNIEFDTPGIYDVTFTITENMTGKTKSVTSQYEVLDMLPTITSSDVTVNLGDMNFNYIEEFAVVASEFTEGDITSSVTYVADFPIDSETNTFNVTGDYDITFTATDSDGNTETSTSTLHIKRVIPEVIIPVDNTVDVIPLSLSADDNYSDYEGTHYTKAKLKNLYNVEGTFDTEGYRTLKVYHNINWDVPGEYDITFEITDNISGEVIETTSTYTVMDILPTIEAENTIEVYIGSDELNYIDAFSAIASEFMENDLYESITVAVDDDILVVDDKYAMTGSFDITFTATDSDGNTVSKTSTLKIKRDLSGIDDFTPIDNGQLVLELDGKDEVTIPETATKNLYSLSSLVNLFSVTSNADTEGLMLYAVNKTNTSIPGQYEVKFVLRNTLNGGRVELPVILNVTDVLPTLENKAEFYTTLNNELDLNNETMEVIATEFVANDLLDSVTINTDEVDYSTPGSYTVYLTATDSDGNVVESTATVYVIDDTPFVTFLSNLTQLEGIEYNMDELKALFEIVHDNEDMLSIVHNIDFNKPGDYPVLIYLTSPGGTEIMKAATYTVTDILPTLSADDNVTVTVGDEIDDYRELFNVIATEFEEGDLIDSVMVNVDDVDLTMAGVYDVIFEVLDSDGNIETVTSTLTVQDAEVIEEDDDTDDTTTDDEDTTTKDTTDGVDTSVDDDEDDVVDDDSTDDTDTNDDTTTDSDTTTDNDTDSDSDDSSSDVANVTDDEILENAKYSEMTLAETGNTLVDLTYLAAIISTFAVIAGIEKHGNKKNKKEVENDT